MFLFLILFLILRILSIPNIGAITTCTVNRTVFNMSSTSVKICIV